MRQLFHNVIGCAVLASLFLTGAATSAAETTLARLIERAQSGEQEPRVKALDELATLGEKGADAVPVLTKLLADDSPVIRAHAARALGHVGRAAKPAAEALTSMLKDPDDAARRQAVQALIAIRPGPDVMLPLFTRLMDDTDPGVRIRVMHAVAEAGPDVVPGMINALKHDKTAYWACLILRDIGPDAKAAVPALTQALEDKRPEIRREASLALGAIGPDAATAAPQLATLLADENARVAATFALGQIGKIPANAEDEIRAGANSNNKMLRTVSAWTLARVHPDDKQLTRQAAVELISRLKDDDPFVRVAAARALAALKLDPQLTLPIFEQELSDRDETAVQHALDALATLGAPAVPRLVDALKHERLRPQIIHIIGQIGPDAAPATEALAELVDDPNGRVATESALALAKIGRAAERAAPALLTALKKPDCENAHAIVYALGKIGAGAAAAEPALAERLKSDDRALAVLSAWALTQIQAPSEQTARPMLPVLIEGLRDDLPQTRQVAAEALGSLGRWAADAVTSLEQATQDENEEVRNAAAAALLEIRGKSAK